MDSRSLTAVGVYTRKDSPFYWIALERADAQPLRLPTKIRKDAEGELATTNKHLARVAYHAGMTALAQGTLLPAKASTPRLRTYWTTVYLPWLAQHYPKAVAETTRVMDTLFLPTLGDLQLSAIRPGVIKDWLDARAGVTPQSKVRELSHLRGLLSRAVEWEHLATHPLEGLALDAAPSREIVRYLSPDEEARLLAALVARDTEAMAARERVNRHRLARRKAPLSAIGAYADALHPMVVLSLHTGMRRGEVFHVEWPAIDWLSRIITIEWWTAKRNRKRVIKSRRLRLNKPALAALSAWHAEQGHPRTGLIFPSHTGAAFTNVDTSWGQVLTTAAIEDFRWHDMRHTFASKLVQRGTALYIVQKLLGHASIATTMKYAHLAPDQAHDAVEALET